MSESEQPPPAPTPVKKNRLNIRPELLIAITSLLVSMTAMFSNIFQTNMQQVQQQSAVWPYIECDNSISSDGFLFKVTNKGVGPAIITQEVYRYKGVEYKTVEALAKAAITDPDFNYNIYGTNPVKGRVLSPQETVRVFSVSDMRFAQMAISASTEIEVYIEYQSIYGKRWVNHGNRVEALD